MDFACSSATKFCMNSFWSYMRSQGFLNTWCKISHWFYLCWEGLRPAGWSIMNHQTSFVLLLLLTTFKQDLLVCSCHISIHWWNRQRVWRRFIDHTTLWLLNFTMSIDMIMRISKKMDTSYAASWNGLTVIEFTAALLRIFLHKENRCRQWLFFFSGPINFNYSRDGFPIANWNWNVFIILRTSLNWK